MSTCRTVVTHGLKALLARQVQSRYVACRISVRQGLAWGKVQCMARLDRQTVSSAPTVSSRPKDSCSWMAELHRALMHACSLNSKRANATCRRMPRPCDHQVRDCSVVRSNSDRVEGSPSLSNTLADVWRWSSAQASRKQMRKCRCRAG